MFYLHHFLEADPGPLPLILLNLLGGGDCNKEDLISASLALLSFFEVFFEVLVAKQRTITHSWVPNFSIPFSKVSSVDGKSAVFSIMTDLEYTHSCDVLHFPPSGIVESFDVPLKKRCGMDILCCCLYTVLIFTKTSDATVTPFDLRCALIFSGRKQIHCVSSPSSFLAFLSVRRKVST